MGNLPTSPAPKQSLTLILSAMWITFLGLRLSLHPRRSAPRLSRRPPRSPLLFWSHSAHPRGIPSRLPPPSNWLRLANLAVLGVACALMLDEFVYLLAMQASDADYVSRPSLVGALVLISSASILLLAVYRARGE